MSKKIQEWRKQLVQNCLIECIHRGDDDPFGMHLRRIEKDKHHAPTEARNGPIREVVYRIEARELGQG